jgi:hypothetical protein
MSLLKYLNEKPEGGGELSYGRSRDDNMPFRGPRALLREEEYDELTEVVNDGHVDVFDLSDPEQHKKINEIIDRVANGWYRLSALDHKFIINEKDGTAKVLVYCVWVVPHRELDQRKLPPGAALSR